MPTAVITNLITELAKRERDAMVAALQDNDAEVELLAAAASDFAQRARDAAITAHHAIRGRQLPQALTALRQAAALTAQGDQRLTAAIERRAAALSVASAVMRATPAGRTQTAQRHLDNDRARRRRQAAP